MAAVSLHAGDTINISLGIRDTKLLTITNVAYPLAFRIENIGRTVIKGGDIPDLFRKGIIHILPKDGQELKQRDDVFGDWFSAVYDLQPGATFEHPVVGNLLTLSTSMKDGAYQVWWTLDDFKSNVLHFTVTKGKVFSNDPET